jgi:hypothetical protein
VKVGVVAVDGGYALKCSVELGTVDKTPSDNGKFSDKSERSVAPYKELLLGLGLTPHFGCSPRNHAVTNVLLHFLGGKLSLADIGYLMHAEYIKVSPNTSIIADLKGLRDGFDVPDEWKSLIGRVLELNRHLVDPEPTLTPCVHSQRLGTSIILLDSELLPKGVLKIDMTPHSLSGGWLAEFNRARASDVTYTVANNKAANNLGAMAAGKVTERYMDRIQSFDPLAVLSLSGLDSEKRTVSDKSVAHDAQQPLVISIMDSLAGLPLPDSNVSRVAAIPHPSLGDLSAKSIKVADIPVEWLRSVRRVFTTAQAHAARIDGFDPTLHPVVQYADDMVGMIDILGKFIAAHEKQTVKATPAKRALAWTTRQEFAFNQYRQVVGRVRTVSDLVQEMGKQAFNMKNQVGG